MMQLLVSVSDAAEARAAVEGGADIIDAKNPSMGALGAVLPDVLSEIRREVGPIHLVTAALGDAEAGNAIEQLARELVPRAARAGAAGVLVDTADKRGAGLLDLWSMLALESWVSEAHAHGLMAAVAGRLRLDDLGVVADAGADVAGVRGAACVGGRVGRVNPERVRALAARVALQRSTI